MKSFTLSSAFRPEAKFLCEPAIAGHCPLAKGETTFFGSSFQLADHLPDSFRTDVKEIFEKLSLLRGFRVKWKGSPVNRYVIFFLQLFNTPGNEVAPGSDIVGENFEYIVFSHGSTCLLFSISVCKAPVRSFQDDFCFCGLHPAGTTFLHFIKCCNIRFNIQQRGAVKNIDSLHCDDIIFNFFQLDERESNVVWTQR